MKKKILIGSILAVALVVLVSVAPSINAFDDPVPDLDCKGDITWTYPPVGETVTGLFTVENIGEEGSLLNWEIVDWPSCGIWTFSPDSGTGLTPENGVVTVVAEIFVTGGEMEGSVMIINSDNPDDYCEIDLSISGPGPLPKKIIGFIDSLNISEYFISFHIKLALRISESYGFPPWPIIRIKFNTGFLNSKYYEGEINENFVNAIFYY